MKFFNLFKKELREMLNTNMIVSLVISFLLFTVIGQFMQSSVNDIQESGTSLTICDMDSTDFTSKIMDSLENMGYKIDKVSITDNSNDDVYISKQTDSQNILVIPNGFTQSIKNGEVSNIENIGKIENTSLMSQVSGSVYSTAISDINNIIKNILIEEKTDFTSQDIEFLDNPVILDDVTVVGETSAKVSSAMVNNVLSSQGMFIPIIIFIIIVFASQMIVTAIATEKIDKTLETLLSTPVSRVSILSAKMLSAGLVSLISSVVYMIGFATSMGSVTGSTQDITSSAIPITYSMISLGLILSPLDYVLIGLDIFLSIMIALSLSMILGVMVNDIKSTQIVMMPVMFMAMIPYFISIFTDISTLSPALKILLNLIPFTHTFNANSNLLFGKISNVWFGIGYQVIFLCICMFFAVRLFKSDKILTASLNFKNRKKS